MIGVSFDPTAQRQSQQATGTSGTPRTGVQEAIKVLSLRLPKVVGARALSPLMTEPSVGGGRVDSVVNSVLAKLFPGAGVPQPMSAPSSPSAAPFLGGAHPLMTPTPTPGFLQPRVIGEIPRPQEAPFTTGPTSRYPNMPTWDGGYNPLPSNMTEPAPKLSPFPSFPDYPAAAPGRDAEPLI